MSISIHRAFFEERIDEQGKILKAGFYSSVHVCIPLGILFGKKPDRYRSTDYVSLRKTKEIKDRKQNNSKKNPKLLIQSFPEPAERPTIFDEIRGVWISDETLSRVFDHSLI